MVPTNTVPPEVLAMVWPDTRPYWASICPVAKRVTPPNGAAIEGVAVPAGWNAMPPAVACTVTLDPEPPAVTGSLIVTDEPVIVIGPFTVEVANTRWVGETASVNAPGVVRLAPMSL